MQVGRLVRDRDSGELGIIKSIDKSSTPYMVDVYFFKTSKTWRMGHYYLELA